MIKAPCKECKERKLGCHAECKRYIEFKDNKKKENKVIRTEKNKRLIGYGFMSQLIIDKD